MTLAPPPCPLAVCLSPPPLALLSTLPGTQMRRDRVARHPGLIRTPAAPKVLPVSLPSLAPQPPHRPPSFPDVEIGRVSRGSPLGPSPSLKPYDCPTIHRYLDFPLTWGHGVGGVALLSGRLLLYCMFPRTPGPCQEPARSSSTAPTPQCTRPAQPLSSGFIAFLAFF